MSLATPPHLDPNLVVDQRPPTKVWFAKDNPSTYVFTKPEGGDWVEGSVVEYVYADGKVRRWIASGPSNGQEIGGEAIDQKQRAQYLKDMADWQEKVASRPAGVTEAIRQAQEQTATLTADRLAQEDVERRRNDGLTEKELKDYNEKLEDNRRAQQQIDAQLAAQAQAAANQAATNQISRERLGLDREQMGLTAEQNTARLGIDKERLEADTAYRQEDVALRKDKQEFEQGDLFNFQKSQAEAQEERARLSSLIEMRKLSDSQANTLYNQWWNENVVLPFKQSEEARLRAAEERQLQQMQDQADQFAATNSLARGRLAAETGNAAVNSYIATFPYRGGPNLAANMAAATNSLAKGSSAGVNFSPDDFAFKADSNDTVWQRGASRALKGVSNYARTLLGGGKTEFAMPTPDMSTAPGQAQGMELPGLEGTSVQDMLKVFQQKYVPQGS